MPQILGKHLSSSLPWPPTPLNYAANPFSWWPNSISPNLASFVPRLTDNRNLGLKSILTGCRRVRVSYLILTIVADLGVRDA